MTKNFNPVTVKATHILLAISSILFVGCNPAQQKNTDLLKQSSKNKFDTLHRDTVILKETFQQEDIPGNEYLSNKLKPIRENFKRINSISKWTSTENKELNESTEGGEAKFYYSNGVLEKIVTRNFGETGQQLTEYYLLNGQLSFVFEKSYKYNRPFYYDSVAMKDNKDSQAFDIDKAEIEEGRSYFENMKLIHQISSQDCGAPFSDDYLLTEQKRLMADLDNLKKLEK